MTFVSCVNFNVCIAIKIKKLQDSVKGMLKHFRIFIAQGNSSAFINFNHNFQFSLKVI